MPCVGGRISRFAGGSIGRATPDAARPALGAKNRLIPRFGRRGRRSPAQRSRLTAGRARADPAIVEEQRGRSALIAATILICSCAGDANRPASTAPSSVSPAPTPTPARQFRVDGYVSDRYTRRPLAASIELLTPAAAVVAAVTANLGAVARRAALECPLLKGGRDGDTIVEGQRAVLRNVQLRLRVPVRPWRDGRPSE